MLVAHSFKHITLEPTLYLQVAERFWDLIFGKLVLKSLLSKLILTLLIISHLLERRNKKLRTKLIA